MPKLQSIQLGSGALHGDDRETRKMISSLPYNYKNTLTMKSGSEWNDEWTDLPSLTELKGNDFNFQCIGLVILESIHLGIDSSRYPSVSVQWNPI